MPVWAIDIDGLEPGIIIGSNNQVALVNEFNQNINTSNVNWAAFQLKTLKQAKIDLVNHKALGNKVQVLFIQAHANKGKMAIFPGKDGIIDTKGVIRGSVITSADELLSAFQIVEYYIPTLAEINKIKNRRKKSRALSEFN